MGLFCTLEEAAQLAHYEIEGILVLVGNGTLREFEVESYLKNRENPHRKAHKEIEAKGGVFYSEAEVLDILEISTEEIQNIIESGKLKSFSDGPNILIKKIDLEEYLENKYTVQKAEPLDIVTRYHVAMVKKTIKWLLDEVEEALTNAEEIMGYNVSVSEARDLMTALIQESSASHHKIVYNHLSEMRKEYSNDIIHKVCGIDSSVDRNIIEYMVENLDRWKSNPDDKPKVSHVDLDDLKDDYDSKW